MNLAMVESICALPEGFVFLTPGEAIRHDKYGHIYPFEMNRKLGYYATISEDVERILDEDANDDELMF